MKKSIWVEQPLPAFFYDRIEYQLAVDLSSLDSFITRLSVSLFKHSAITECNVSATTIHGRKFRYSTINQDPEVSIVDAVARLRRELLRQQNLGKVGRNFDGGINREKRASVPSLYPQK